jgi:hypothetical protein
MQLIASTRPSSPSAPYDLHDDVTDTIHTAAPPILGQIEKP